MPNAANYINCTACGEPVAPEVLWQGDLCAGCAVARDQTVCQRCRGHGETWTGGLGADGHRKRSWVACPECWGRERE